MNNTTPVASTKDSATNKDKQKVRPSKLKLGKLGIERIVK